MISRHCVDGGGFTEPSVATTESLVSEWLTVPSFVGAYGALDFLGHRWLVRSEDENIVFRCPCGVVLRRMDHGKRWALVEAGVEVEFAERLKGGAPLVTRIAREVDRAFDSFEMAAYDTIFHPRNINQPVKFRASWEGGVFVAPDWDKPFTFVVENKTAFVKGEKKRRVNSEGSPTATVQDGALVAPIFVSGSDFYKEGTYVFWDVVWSDCPALLATTQVFLPAWLPMFNRLWPWSPFLAAKKPHREISKYKTSLKQYHAGKIAVHTFGSDAQIVLGDLVEWFFGLDPYESILWVNRLENELIAVFPLPPNDTVERNG